MLPFIALKALSFLPFGGMLRGAMGKFVLILVVVGALAYGYWKWKDNIKTAIINQINQETAETILKEKEDQIRKEREFIDRQGKLAKEILIRQRKQIENKNKLSNIIDNVKPEDDGPVAPILDSIFEQINTFEGNTEPANKDEVDKDPPSILDNAVDSVKSTGNSAIDAWKKLTK
jgi:hypothetical protein